MGTIALKKNAKYNKIVVCDWEKNYINMDRGGNGYEISNTFGF